MTPAQGENGNLYSIREEWKEAERTSMLGMVIFLGSWAMLFAGFFYVFGSYRLSLSTWPPAGAEPLPFLLPCINTVVIVLSSVTVFVSVRALRMGKIRAARIGWWATIALGAVFMAMQWHLWSSVWVAGQELDTNLYSSYFYVLTAFHALHVFVGFLLLLWIIPQLYKAPFPLRQVRAKMVGMFWHFVDIVWVLLFVIVFAL